MPEGVFQADCLDFLASMPLEAVDLIYVDPPFFSGKERRSEGASFADAWPDLETYEAWLMTRIEAMWAVLRPGGTLWVHLDHHAVHGVKVRMDQRLGRENFRNDVIWCYNGGGTPKRDFPRKHDTLLRYAKGEGYVFHVLRRPFKTNTQEVGRHSTRAKRVEIDLARGTPLTDWWDDIPTVTGWSPERCGFPTQKPLGLLRRIVRTTSNPGDLVADFFCGSGTTLVAAAGLGRRLLGVDLSADAVGLARRRLTEGLFDGFGQAHGASEGG